MTDDLEQHGLGAIDSPPDDRDWQIDALYALEGRAPMLALPASYLVPGPYPPILDQHATPMCVAYSSSTLKAYEDLRDQGSFDFDEAKFFRDIGGTANGAVIRDAFKRMLTYGYPVVGGSEFTHRIAAYYSIPVQRGMIQSALVDFGPLILGGTWFNSWFRPLNGVLPPPSGGIAGGHAIAAVGWDAQRGLRLRNSWGTHWGQGGDAFLPWPFIVHFREAWKAVDVVSTPPPTRKYRIHIQSHAVVRQARFAGKCISGWDNQAWGPQPSGAPCEAPALRKGCRSGQALVARVTAGAFRKRYVRIGNGVSLETIP